MIRPTCT